MPTKKKPVKKTVAKKPVKKAGPSDRKLNKLVEIIRGVPVPSLEEIEIALADAETAVERLLDETLALTVEKARAEERVLRLEAQLSGCSIAAAGWTSVPHDLVKGGYAWSTALEDVTHLHDRMQLAEQRLEAETSNSTILFQDRTEALVECVRLEVVLKESQRELSNITADRDGWKESYEHLGRSLDEVVKERDHAERLLAETERELNDAYNKMGAEPAFLSQNELEDWADCSIPTTIDMSNKMGPVYIDQCTVSLEGKGPVYLMDAVLPDGEVVTSRYDAGKCWHLDAVPEERRIRLTLACQRLLGAI